MLCLDSGVTVWLGQCGAGDRVTVWLGPGSVWGWGQGSVGGQLPSGGENTARGNQTFFLAPLRQHTLFGGPSCELRSWKEQEEGVERLVGWGDWLAVELPREP